VRLAVADLFVVGLGFDLVGGWFLARGLIARPGIIVQRNATFLGSSAPGAFAAAEDRVDGQFGVAALMFGFLLQAIGYMLDLGSGDTSSPSTCRALTALGLLVLAVIAALSAGLLVRDRQLRRLLIEMAHWRATSTMEAPIREARADPNDLTAWGIAMGEPRREGENNWEYAKRVFKLSDDQLIEPAR
jgi:hypothetical protein